MTRFPQIATHVGTADRVMQENHVGPQDDDDDDNKDGDSAIAILTAPEES
ncbi:MAG TPA: hypothetical protein VIZ18_15890 [Ktedonobacteraceae bacterium]